jgi:predicted 3-demethylubiquinone-9 3-methyltransferase (glyoxalase superfamily)
LSKGGTALMELGGYPFSERYGWVQDRYGLSWQIVPTILGEMFQDKDAGKSESHASDASNEEDQN